MNICVFRIAYIHKRHMRNTSYHIDDSSKRLHHTTHTFSSNYNFCGSTENEPSLILIAEGEPTWGDKSRGEVKHDENDARINMMMLRM